ncbi:EcsC family protein [Bacillus sp. DNRA2]|uniref:EcsC family protein n=1 Tax=Bacillus sp. DNRA2 TaxID=2723053 RepID=UPI00145F89F1|nr:EcsC family protein [Bacillus sp. DNRA2]
MSLTEYEEKVLQTIVEWNNQIDQYHPNDFELTFDKYIDRTFSLLPENIQEQFFSVIDSWLFHLHAMIQGAQLQMDAKERILTAGRIFNPDITQLEDLRSLRIEQLQYIAQQQISRHRFYSMIQGGLSGTGGALLLGSDIPAMAVINLRVVQLIAMTYGFEVNTPFEMMTSLKVFHSSSLPTRLQAKAWEELITDLRGHHTKYFYEGKEEISDISWLEQPIKQLFKLLVISLFKKKTMKGIPVIAMGIGASSNYLFTRRVTEFAHKYYQMRYLIEKRGESLE